VNNNNNGSVSLAELNELLTVRCGLTSGFSGGDGSWVSKVAVNILNKHVVNCSLLVRQGDNK